MNLYFDCFSGISGDMTLGALISAGVPGDWLETQLKTLNLEGFGLAIAPAVKNGIQATQVTVHYDRHEKPRNYNQIKQLIDASGFNETVRQTSLRIFEKLAEAEAKVHQCDKAHVHFHEVGGVDAIADIVGTALCLDYLNITRCACSVIPLGSGFVQCAHGTLPVPAPAVTEILKHIPVKGDDTGVEIVTPTGAAIVAAVCDDFGQMPAGLIKATGYGSGTRTLADRPNLLRIFLTQAEYRSEDVIDVIETTIDDMNPELYGFLMDKLFQCGALDVCLIPVYMKKNRPGVIVKVLVAKTGFHAVSGCLLNETTTAGIRFYEAGRTVLPRQIVQMPTSYGQVDVKKITKPDGHIYLSPEYEHCRQIASERGLCLMTVMETIKNEINSSFDRI